MKRSVLVWFAILLISTSKGQDNPETVTIGTQTWMVKNLDVDHYQNGDPIPEVKDAAKWAALTTGAWCYYNNDPANGKIYGKLYNWYAVNDPRGLAPKGWRVPFDYEWTRLTDQLGGEKVAGKAMKETGTKHWTSPNKGATNSGGFSGLPGGCRLAEEGLFKSIGVGGFWWSSTHTITDDLKVYAWARNLDYDYVDVLKNLVPKQYGFSVRCIRD